METNQLTIFLAERESGNRKRKETIQKITEILLGPQTRIEDCVAVLVRLLEEYGGASIFYVTWDLRGGRGGKSYVQKAFIKTYILDISIFYLYFVFVVAICICILYSTLYLYLEHVFVFLFCICILQLYFVFVFCICILYLYFVFVFCIFILYLYFVYVFYILYFVFVFCICILCLYLIFVLIKKRLAIP